MIRKAKSPKQATYTLQVVVEMDEDNKYVAWCPALEACYTQGDTFEEAIENIRDVIAMCLEELREEKREIDVRYPEIVGFKQVEVTV